MPLLIMFSLIVKSRVLYLFDNQEVINTKFNSLKKPAVIFIRHPNIFPFLYLLVKKICF